MQCEYPQKYLLLQYCCLLDNYLKVHNDFLCATVQCVQCVPIFFGVYIWKQSSEKFMWKYEEYSHRNKTTEKNICERKRTCGLENIEGKKLNH